MKTLNTALFLIFFSLATNLEAQNPLNRFYEIDNLHSKELIKGVVRDEMGFVWVATDGGVLRYNGEETLVSNRMGSPYVKEFLIRKNGELLTIHDTGIEQIHFSTDSIYFESLFSDDDSIALAYPKSIYEDKDSSIWIGEINAIVKIGKDGIKRYPFGSAFQSISYHHSFSFTEDAFGHLWVAPFKGNLLCYNEKTDSFDKVVIDKALTEVSAIAAIRGDHLLISGKEGFVIVKTDSKKDILASEFIGKAKNISDMIVVQGSQVFLATWNNGLYHFDFDTGTASLIHLETVGVRDVIDLNYNIRSRELWIAGAESIGVLKNTQVNTFDKIGDSRIESLTFDIDRGCYFSTGEQVFYVDDVENGSLEHVFYSGETYFSTILYDESNLWVGDFFGLIYYHDFKSDKPIYLVDEPSGTVKFIYQDKAVNKWFTGRTNGLIRVDQEKNVKVFDHIRSSVVVRESNSGKLLCGSNGKNSLLSIYNSDEDKFSTIGLTFDFMVPDNILLNDFQFDDQENIWLATNNGLWFVENENERYQTVKRIDVQGFDERGTIRAIAISGNFIWLAYADGLVLYNENEPLLFNKDSGLPSNILKERGLKYGKGGRLYIYTAKGLAAIDERQIQFKKSRPPVYESIVVNGNTVDLTENGDVIFPYNARMECDFISLSFPSSSLEYQSRVLGYDDNWSQPSTNTNMSILGFSSGKYTMQVRAKKGGHLWSDPLSFSFSVSKPWYSEWWSLAMFFVAAMLIIILSVQVHNRNLIRQKRKLQETIEQRTEEINSQKNEIIEQQEKLIKQKEELLKKNQDIHNSEQSRDKAELNFLHLKEKQLQEQIEYKNKQITTHALNILQKNETLKDLRVEINAVLKKPEKSTVAELKKTLKLIDGSFKLDKDWEDFKLYFEQIYTGFYAKLKVNFPGITNHEMRHCALIRLNLPISECASILGISHDSVKVSRSRLRKKLGLVANQGLADFIMSL